jgi:hypothetical protein
LNLLKTIANEFRNYPNEFHNGGSWSMVNGFMDWGCCLKKKEKKKFCEAINAANAVDNYSFMKTSTVKRSSQTECLLRLSAAATVMLHQSINSNFKLLV